MKVKKGTKRKGGGKLKTKARKQKKRREMKAREERGKKGKKKIRKEKENKYLNPEKLLTPYRACYHNVYKPLLLLARAHMILL